MSLKSAAAFRTIGEVAEELHLPAHVLRFWETKFPEIRPLKRGGGRRYYRPEDVQLLRRIRHLLYEDGLTIRGAQQALRRGSSGTGSWTSVPVPDGPGPDHRPPAEELPVSTAADAWQGTPPVDDAEIPGDASFDAPEAEGAIYRAELEYLLEELKDLRATLAMARTG